MTQLTGSDKQIKWATEIREGAAAAIHAGLSQQPGFTNLPKATQDRIADELTACLTWTEADRWIDGRGHLFNWALAYYGGESGNSNAIQPHPRRVRAGRRRLTTEIVEAETHTETDDRAAHPTAHDSAEAPNTVISIDVLTAEIADRYDLPLAAVRDDIIALAGQLDDEVTDEGFTADGADLIRRQFAETRGDDRSLSSAARSMLDELASIAGRRDELVRALMATSAPRQMIADAAGVKVRRLYQIANGQ